VRQQLVLGWVRERAIALTGLLVLGPELVRELTRMVIEKAQRDTRFTGKRPQTAAKNDGQPRRFQPNRVNVGSAYTQVPP
jgi:hypothetical protein